MVPQPVEHLNIPRMPSATLLLGKEILYQAPVTDGLAGSIKDLSRHEDADPWLHRDHASGPLEVFPPHKRDEVGSGAAHDGQVRGAVVDVV